MAGLQQRSNSRNKAMAVNDAVAKPNGAAPAAAAAATGKGLPVEVKLVICVLGIYSCYMLSGILQEKTFSYRSEEGSRFSATLFLLWIQCVVNVVFAYFCMLFYGRSGDKMPQELFSMAGFAYIGAMVCSIEALKYVNFPTKELGKSCKMIPVMLFGVLFAKKRYDAREYFCVALITAGIVTFNLAGLPHDKKDKDNSAYGLGLLCSSLILDGVTGSAQERLKAACKPTVHEMMFFMNAWALFFLSVAAYASGHFVDGLAYCSSNPSVMAAHYSSAMRASVGFFLEKAMPTYVSWMAWTIFQSAVNVSAIGCSNYVLGLSLAAAFGQNFIYFTINNFNPLVCTTITTTRKFFTIVSSVIIFGHAIGPKQWGGVAMVFAGIGYEMRCKYQRHQAKQIKS